MANDVLNLRKSLTKSALYNIPIGTKNQSGNEIGIFESGDFYDQLDLNLTFAAFAPYVPPNTHPILHGIDGATAPFENQIGEESLLDMSIIFPLIYPQQAILFQVDDYKEVLSTTVHGAFGNTFLDALDAVSLFRLRDVFVQILRSCIIANPKGSRTARSRMVMPPKTPSE